MFCTMSYQINLLEVPFLNVDSSHLHRYNSELYSQLAGGCNQRVQTAWLLLGLAIERSWLALGRLFLFSFAQINLETVF